MGLFLVDDSFDNIPRLFSLDLLLSRRSAEYFRTTILIRRVILLRYI